ncbi:hypothetical protein ACFYUD_01890 [Nocardia tengchongensis]|uniref:hypothetical protein n=1 Tax=Nocardia tengchongensis TaxID=2055889 RepID=UPI0036D144C8
MSDRHSRSAAKSYVAQQVRPLFGGRIVWRTGLAQPATLRPRRGPGKVRLGTRRAAGRAAADQAGQPARTDTGEFQPGEAQPGPEGPGDVTTGPVADRHPDPAGRKRTGVIVPVVPYAERGRIATGPAAPAEGADRAGKTWDWFVNATAWDWYTNSSDKTDRGDAGA